MCHLGPYSDWPLNSWIVKWFITHELRNILMAGTKTVSQFKKKNPQKLGNGRLITIHRDLVISWNPNANWNWGLYWLTCENTTTSWITDRFTKNTGVKGFWLSRIDVIESVYQSLQFSSFFMVNSSHPQSVYINNWFATEFATKLS